MADFQLNLTDEERELLMDILTSELKEKRVEEHRTDSMDFKRIVAHQEELIEQMLNKLRRVPVA
jgi:uncharacterized protein YeaC (DUF1315 family)